MCARAQTYAIPHHVATWDPNNMACIDHQSRAYLCCVVSVCVCVNLCVCVSDALSNKPKTHKHTFTIKLRRCGCQQTTHNCHSNNNNTNHNNDTTIIINNNNNTPQGHSGPGDTNRRRHRGPNRQRNRHDTDARRSTQYRQLAGEYGLMFPFLFCFVLS